MNTTNVQFAGQTDHIFVRKKQTHLTRNQALLGVDLLKKIHLAGSNFLLRRICSTRRLVISQNACLRETMRQRLSSRPKNMISDLFAEPLLYLTGQHRCAIQLESGCSLHYHRIGSASVQEQELRERLICCHALPLFWPCRI